MHFVLELKIIIGETALDGETEKPLKALINLKEHQVQIGPKTAVFADRVEWLVFLNFAFYPQKPISTQEVANIADLAGSKKLFSASETVKKLRFALEKKSA